MFHDVTRNLGKVLDVVSGMWLDEGMTKNEMLNKADELDGKADTLRMALLAPSMKEDALRAKADELRRAAR